jgi:hypothetical protein
MMFSAMICFWVVVNITPRTGVRWLAYGTLCLVWLCWHQGLVTRSVRVSYFLVFVGPVEHHVYICQWAMSFCFLQTLALNTWGRGILFGEARAIADIWVKINGWYCFLLGLWLVFVSIDGVYEDIVFANCYRNFFHLVSDAKSAGAITDFVTVRLSLIWARFVHISDFLLWYVLLVVELCLYLRVPLKVPCTVLLTLCCYSLLPYLVDFLETTVGVLDTAAALVDAFGHAIALLMRLNH